MPLYFATAILAFPATAPTRDALRVALDDLTSNIENVDDRGFDNATATMVAALGTLEEARQDYRDECIFWPRSIIPWLRSDILTIAFVGGVMKERIFGDPNNSLHAGWLNVLKYYRHYRSEGSMHKIEEIEKLLKEEKRHTLADHASKVQKEHPLLFDRIGYSGSK